MAAEEVRASLPRLLQDTSSRAFRLICRRTPLGLCTWILVRASLPRLLQDTFSRALRFICRWGPLGLCTWILFCSTASGIENPPSSISLDEALSSRQDLWGLAAMSQTNGPSYEFFAPLLPPLPYV